MINDFVPAEIISRKQEIFNDVMMWLLERNALSIRNEKIIFISDRIPKEQLMVCNVKTKMIMQIKNACEKM